MTLHPVMTPKRMAWLISLIEKGPRPRGKGRTGYDCMQLGWTEWDFKRDGKPISSEEAWEAMRAGIHDFTMDGERITAAGKKALRGAGYDRLEEKP